MSDSKRLLDAQSIDDILKDVLITKEVFQNDKGESVYYNRLRLVFDDNDTVDLKATPEVKIAVYYAKKGLTAK